MSGLFAPKLLHEVVMKLKDLKNRRLVRFIGGFEVFKVTRRDTVPYGKIVYLLDMTGRPRHDFRTHDQNREVNLEYV